MKQIMVLLLSTALGVIMMSCKESGTNPPEEKPPGYQEDIPWPSLADSPWPMYRLNPRNNCLLSFNSPNISTFKNILGDSIYLKSPITLLNDSSIIAVIQRGVENPKLTVFNFNGVILWQYSFERWEMDCSAPVVLKDSSVIVTTPLSNKISCIKLYSGLEWSIEIGKSNLSGINVDRDGNIFTVTYENGSMDAVSLNKNGIITWRLSNLDFRGTELNSVSLSPDGSLLLIPGNNSYYPVETNTGIVKWKIEGKRNIPPPVFDAKGIIYLSKNEGGKTYLFALKLDNTVKWRALLSMDSSKSGNYEIIINKRGNIIVGFDTLTCFSYDGEIKWQIPLEGYIEGPIISDAEDNLCLIVSSGVKEILKIGNNGVVSERVTIKNSFKLGFPLIVTKNNIILGEFRGNEILIFE